jgi:hypothetical protein
MAVVFAGFCAAFGLMGGLLFVPFFGTIAGMCLFAFVRFKDNTTGSRLSPTVPLVLGVALLAGGGFGFLDDTLTPRHSPGVIEARFIDEVPRKGGVNRFESVRIQTDNSNDVKVVHSSRLYDYMANPESREVLVVRSHFLHRLLEVRTSDITADQRWNSSQGLLYEAAAALIMGGVAIAGAAILALWRRFS